MPFPLVTFSFSHCWFHVKHLQDNGGKRVSPPTPTTSQLSTSSLKGANALHVLDHLLGLRSFVILLLLPSSLLLTLALMLSQLPLEMSCGSNRGATKPTEAAPFCRNSCALFKSTPDCQTASRRQKQPSRSQVLQQHQGTASGWELQPDDTSNLLLLFLRFANLVGLVELSRGAATRDADDVAGAAPGDDLPWRKRQSTGPPRLEEQRARHLRDEDRSDDELGSSIERVLSILDVHDGPAADHDLAVVLLAEVSHGVKALGGSEGELDDLEASVNGSLHGLGSSLSRGGAEHSAGAMLRHGSQTKGRDRLNSVSTLQGREHVREKWE
eukprot:750553-Hanusia_phi.AAC.3